MQNCNILNVVVFLKQYLKHHFLVINENTISTNACFCVEIYSFSLAFYVLLTIMLTLLLNILQDSSFSNQITFILHIQGVFSLPGRGFHQRVTLISSVPHVDFINYLTCTMTSSSVIGIDEINVTR